MARSGASAKHLSLGWAVVVVLLAILLGAAGTVALLSNLFLKKWFPWDAVQSGVTPLDLMKLGVAIVAGLAGTIALVVAYRKQRNAELDQTGFTQRFGAAASQMGSSVATERLAGGYAMSALADEWPLGRQQCVDVICGYLRLDVAALSGSSAGSSSHKRGVGRQNEIEIRKTIGRIVAQHLGKGAANSWSALNLDFERASLFSLDLSDAIFEAAVNFTDATFAERTSFSSAHFGGNVRFDRCSFTGDTSISKATFSAQADFSGSTFAHRLNLDETKFLDNALFMATEFSELASFNSTNFGGRSDFSKATFAKRADFDGAIHSAAADFTDVRFLDDGFFNRARFEGGATFQGASFQGGAAFQFCVFREQQAGQLAADFRSVSVARNGDFLKTQFGQCDFTYANFGAAADFTDAQFTGQAMFFQVKFGEVAGFEGARFGGVTSFRASEFNGAANFQRVEFRDVAVLQLVTFGGNALFKDAIFGDEMGFQETQFQQAADFDAIDVRKGDPASAAWVKAKFLDVIVLKPNAIRWGPLYPGP